MSGLAQAQLIDLLIDLFSTSELRQIVTDYAPEPVPQIEWEQPLGRVAVQVVTELDRRGLLYRAFFERLRQERPLRESEIAKVAASWRIELPSTGTADVRKVLACIHTEHDRDAFLQLRTYLVPLERENSLLIIGVERTAKLEKLLPRANIVLVFLSAELLQSDLGQRMGWHLESLPERTRYLSVVLRRCLWERTPLGARRPLFDEAIEQASSPAQLWAELAAQISRLVERPPALPTEQPAARSLELETLGPQVAAVEIVPIFDIFSTTTTPAPTMVETEEIRRLDYELRNLGKALVLEGPSGTGKTSAAQAAIQRARAAGRSDWRDRYFQCKAEDDRARLATLVQAPLRDASGFVLVDDFHELEPAQQQTVGRFAKAALDLQDRKLKIVLIGINGIGSTLIAGIPDLGGGRATVIPFGRQPDQVVHEMIAKGEAAANVVFSRKQDIVEDVRGSLMLAQLICETMLEQQQIRETQRRRRTISTRVHEIRDALLGTLRDQFHQRLGDFVACDAGCDQRGAGIAALWSLGNSDTGSIALADVRGRFPDLSDSFDALIDHAATPGRWRELLFWSAIDGRLALADPKLGFYLRKLAWEPFARDCGIRITLSSEGPVFVAATRRPDPPSVSAADPHGTAPATPASKDVIRLLHLSDFHFRTTTTWDASTVLGRLADDVAVLVEREGKPDLLVLTGDIAFSGQRDEYELAKKWLLDKLLPAARLTPGELAIAPGNHDADRKAVGTVARAVQKALLEARSDAELTAVLGAAAERVNLLARHAAFVEFLNQLGAGGRTWDVPWGSVVHELRGATVQIAAFCSSFMSSGDADHGQLLLGLWQATELLRDADSADLVISAMHHPWSYFAEFDEPARAEVRRSSHILLRGHLHETRVEQISSSDHSGFVEIAAGACYETSRYPNEYHLIEADLRTREVRVRPRVWSSGRRAWQHDYNLFQGEVGRMQMRPRAR